MTITPENLSKIYNRYPHDRIAGYQRDYDYSKHAIYDKNLRPDGIVLVKQGDPERGIPNTYRSAPVNRISFPIEQEITDTHTAFAVGMPVKLQSSPSSPEEGELLDHIMEVNRDCKIDYHNRSVVRAWLSETRVAEYWYYDKTKDQFRTVIWSPFRGDVLVPIKDSTGHLTEFIRYYKTKDHDTLQETKHAMCISATEVVEYSYNKEWQEVDRYHHGFAKIPVVYMDRPEPIYAPIKSLRERLETNVSNYADIVDYNFAPKLIYKNVDSIDVENTGRTSVVKTTGETDIHYLTWNQSPETAKYEIESMLDRIYSITNTPRTTPRDMHGAGAAFSGVAFRYTFLGTHLAVRRYEEAIGEFLTRRYNLLCHCIATRRPLLKEASKSLVITPQLQPYTIDNEREHLQNILLANGGKPVMSHLDGIRAFGRSSDPEGTLRRIQEEEQQGSPSPNSDRK